MINSIWVYITNDKIKTINIMKQLIYYIRLTDGTEIISITRNDAVEKINNYYKDENYYEPISCSVFDRLIINGKTTSYIEIANKTPINEYYKTEVDLFILNDKKQRTDDAMKKAINRYVNKLYHANHIVREEVNNINEILLLKNECDNEIIEDTINNDILNHDINNDNEIDEMTIKTDEILNNDIKSDDEIIKDEIKTIQVIKDEIEPLYIVDDEVKTDIKSEITNTEEELNNNILKSLTDYLLHNADDDTRINKTDIKNYYDNNKEEVEMLFMNNNMGLLMTDDKPKKKQKHKIIKQKIKTLRSRHNRQNKTFKKTQLY